MPLLSGSKLCYCRRKIRQCQGLSSQFVCGESCGLRFLGVFGASGRPAKGIQVGGWPCAHPGKCPPSPFPRACTLCFGPFHATGAKAVPGMAREVQAADGQAAWAGGGLVTSACPLRRPPAPAWVRIDVAAHQSRTGQLGKLDMRPRTHEIH